VRLVEGTTRNGDRLKLPPTFKSARTVQCHAVALCHTTCCHTVSHDFTVLRPETIRGRVGTGRSAGLYARDRHRYRGSGARTTKPVCQDHNIALRAKVALSAIKGERTLTELAPFDYVHLQHRVEQGCSSLTVSTTTSETRCALDAAYVGRGRLLSHDAMQHDVMSCQVIDEHALPYNLHILVLDMRPTEGPPRDGDRLRLPSIFKSDGEVKRHAVVLRHITYCHMTSCDGAVLRPKTA